MSSVLMSDQVFDNEIPFCKVSTKEAKTELERIFLRNRISYFIEWQDKNILQRIFVGNSGRISCTIRINSADYLRARELVYGLEDIRVRDYTRQLRQVIEREPSRKIERRNESVRRSRSSRQPVIRKTSSRTRRSQSSAGNRRRREAV